MTRVAVFIDGFNVYHALSDNPNYRRFKWLDYWKLAERYLLQNDRLVKVLFFTAYAYWTRDRVQRHRRLVKAQIERGVEVVFGKFRERQKYCNVCSNSYTGHEEKRTDVNIAVKLLQLAYRNDYDKAIIITGDSDIVPAIEAVRSTFPGKRVGVVVPIGRRADEIKQAADFSILMTRDDLLGSLLPQRIQLRDGGVLTCPDEWL
jgi:uncharacterized LabA/DUF88 family protein